MSNVSFIDCSTCQGGFVPASSFLSSILEYCLQCLQVLLLELQLLADDVLPVLSSSFFWVHACTLWHHEGEHALLGGRPVVPKPRTELLAASALSTKTPLSKGTRDCCPHHVKLFCMLVVILPEADLERKETGNGIYTPCPRHHSHWVCLPLLGGSG
eukprot:6466464-Amphidinium_carterae.3